MPFVSGSGSKTGFSGRKFLCFEEVLFGAAIFFGERGEKLREIAVELRWKNNNIGKKKLLKKMRRTEDRERSERSKLKCMQFMDLDEVDDDDEKEENA